MNLDDVLTVKQVSDIIGVAPVTVRKWCRAGGIFPNARKVKMGVVTWVVPKSDIDGWEKRRPSPGRPPGGGSGGKRAYTVCVDDKVVGTFAVTKIGVNRVATVAREAASFMGDPARVRVMLGDVDVTAKFLKVGDDGTDA